MILDMAPTAHRIDWVKVQHRAKLAGAFALTFAAGGWVASIRSQEASLPYLQRAAIQQERLQEIAGPNPIAAIKCERRKSAAAEVVADQAVAISNFTAVPKQLLAAIPDCPTAKAKR
jgi:hypothetical protein